MALKVFAGYFAGLVCFISVVVYLVAIARGKVTSNRVGWGIWVFVQLMFTVSYYQAAAKPSAIWVSVVYTVGTVAIFFSLLRWGGKGSFAWVEQSCLVAVAGVIVFWIISRKPVATLSLTMVIDIFGSIPVAVSAFQNPEKEHKLAWALGFASNALNLLAVPRWDYANAAYPVYLATGVGIIAFLVCFPKAFRPKPEVSTFWH